MRGGWRAAANGGGDSLSSSTNSSSNKGAGRRSPGGSGELLVGRDADVAATAAVTTNAGGAGNRRSSLDEQQQPPPVHCLSGPIGVLAPTECDKSVSSSNSNRWSAVAEAPPRPVAAPAAAEGEGSALLIIDGSHVRLMAHRQPNGSELDYERLVSFFQRLYGVPVREAYFVDTYVEPGFEEASLQRANITVVLGRMKKANYRRVAPPHDMVAVHCQGGVDSRITALLLTRGLGLRDELPDRAVRYKVTRVVLLTSDTDFEHAISEVVAHGKHLALVGFTTPGNHILSAIASSYLDITKNWEAVRREISIIPTPPPPPPTIPITTTTGTPVMVITSTRSSSSNPPPGRRLSGSLSSSSKPQAPPQITPTTTTTALGSSGSGSKSPAPLPPGLLPPLQQQQLVELHLEADDLNRLARLAFVEAQRKPPPPTTTTNLHGTTDSSSSSVVRQYFPSPWREHLIPGSLSRFSTHMAREHQVTDPAIVHECWRHMLRFLPVFGARNTLLSKDWQEVLVRAAEQGKRLDNGGRDEGSGGGASSSSSSIICRTFRRMDLVLLKRFPCLSSLFVYYCRSSYAKQVLGGCSDQELQDLWAYVRAFCSTAQLHVLRRQEWELYRINNNNNTHHHLRQQEVGGEASGGVVEDSSFDEFVASGRADSAFASCPPTPPTPAVVIADGSSTSGSGDHHQNTSISAKQEEEEGGEDKEEEEQEEEGGDDDYYDQDSSIPSPQLALRQREAAAGGGGSSSGSHNVGCAEAGDRADSMFGDMRMVMPVGRRLVQMVVDLLLSGVKGQALHAALQERVELRQQVTGPMLLLAVFKAVAAGLGRQNHEAISEALASVQWLQWDEYGTALRASLQGGDPAEQLGALVVVQRMCSFLHFPNCPPQQQGGCSSYLIDRLFTLLHQHHFIDKDVFHAWWSDSSNLDDDRMKTISQTVSFFATLYEAEPEDEEEGSLGSPILPEEQQPPLQKRLSSALRLMLEPPPPPSTTTAKPSPPPSRAGSKRSLQPGAGSPLALHLAQQQGSGGSHGSSGGGLSRQGSSRMSNTTTTTVSTPSSRMSNTTTTTVSTPSSTSGEEEAAAILQNNGGSSSSSSNNHDHNKASTGRSSERLGSRQSSRRTMASGEEEDGGGGGGWQSLECWDVGDGVELVDDGDYGDGGDDGGDDGERVLLPDSPERSPPPKAGGGGAPPPGVVVARASSNGSSNSSLLADIRLQQTRSVLRLMDNPDSLQRFLSS